jgi:hypothetical protein
MAALEHALREQLLEQHSPGVDSLDPDPQRLPFVRVPADTPVSSPGMGTVFGGSMPVPRVVNRRS